MYNTPKAPKKNKNIKKASAMDTFVALSPHASEIGAGMAQGLGTIAGVIGGYKAGKKVVSGVKNTAKSVKSMGRFMGGGR